MYGGAVGFEKYQFLNFWLKLGEYIFFVRLVIITIKVVMFAGFGFLNFLAYLVILGEFTI